MEELTLTVPALLFPAISLILLAYTNRFLSYAQLIRTLKAQYLQHRSDLTAAQIDNLRRRLYLTRAMQILGIASLFLCVVTMFLLYIGLQLVAAYVFGAGATQSSAQAIAALVSLGYSQSEAALAIAKIDATLPVEEIIKLALRSMAGRR